MNRIVAIACAVVVSAAATPRRAEAQGTEPFIGQIAWVAFDFAPRGWLPCEGQLLSIAQNQALFALLGTQYGGNGRTTFALPDMRSRVPVHAADNTAGMTLTPRVVGETGGTEYQTLSVTQLPAPRA
jgi:microcystin-dependent protein